MLLEGRGNHLRWAMDTFGLRVDIRVERLIQNAIWPGFGPKTQGARDVLRLHMESAGNRFMKGLGDEPCFVR